MRTREDKFQFDHVNLFFINHLRAFLFAIGEMFRTPLATTMTLTVIGIAMALPSVLYVLLKDVEGFNQYWKGSPSISLYLKLELSPYQINSVLQELKTNAEIAHLQYISPEQGLDEFERSMGLSGVLINLNKNPLPGVIIVTPIKKYQSAAQLEQLAHALEKNNWVDLAQLDRAWITRLYALVQIAQRITYALGLLFGMGVILIIANTIRLITQNSRQEIAILRLIGATAAFIRRPLLYRGMLYGLFGGIIAWILVGLLFWWLSAPFGILAESYHSQLNLKGFDLIAGLSILFTCSLLGLIGAWFAVNKYLQAPESL